MDTKRKPAVLTAAFLCACTLLGSDPIVAQEGDGASRTYFDNITLDPDGHICYVESIDGTPQNRVEFRDEGRGLMSLYYTAANVVRKVESTDYDRDSRPDLIVIEWTRDGTNISRTLFYRGPAYQAHLLRHLAHALRTATHPLIAHRPEEQERAKEIRRHIDVLSHRTIPGDETGSYTTDGVFTGTMHKDVQYAFTAADNLNGALSSIVAGDYRMLSQKPEFVSNHRIDIDILLSLDPSVRRASR